MIELPYFGLFFVEIAGDFFEGLLEKLVFANNDDDLVGLAVLPRANGQRLHRVQEGQELDHPVPANEDVQPLIEGGETPFKRRFLHAEIDFFLENALSFFGFNDGRVILDLFLLEILHQIDFLVEVVFKVKLLRNARHHNLLEGDQKLPFELGEVALREGNVEAVRDDFVDVRADLLDPVLRIVLEA